MEAFLTGIGLGLGVAVVSSLVAFLGYDIEFLSVRKRERG